MFWLRRHLKIVSDDGSKDKIDYNKTDAEDNVETWAISKDAIESVRPCRAFFGPVGSQEEKVVPGYMTLHLHSEKELIICEVTAGALLKAIGVQSLPCKRRN